MAASMVAPPPADQRTFLGHPFGLSTLFFTELWERFSYYGMRALLVLFMTDVTTNGGLNMSVVKSTAIYGLYTFGVYALALPGGWVADRLLGQRKAVFYGGVIIAVGHYTLAIPTLWGFYAGLALVVIGTGLLKPNVSAIVGELYPRDDPARRDAGFSIFYMGINIGAFAGPLICGYLGEEVNWHIGFSAAGVGMTLGLIYYVRGKKYLGDAGDLKAEAAGDRSMAEAKRRFMMGLAAIAGLVLAIYGLNASGLSWSLGFRGTTYQLLPLTLIVFAQLTGVILMVLVVFYFAYVIVFACHDATERKRVGVIFFLFLGAAMFWSGFEQAGSSMNLFAEDFTNRVVFGWEAPTSWLQAVNPLFIILLAPVMGGVWIWLGSRNPSIPVKFGVGLILLGVGFLVMSWGSQFIEAGKVSPMWLVVTYFFHTVGELCLSPVGLSSITKLSPHRLVGQMMGTWFMGAALGNLIAGLIAGYIEAMPQTLLFGTVAGVVMGTGLVFFVLAVPIRSLTVGIK